MAAPSLIGRARELGEIDQLLGRASEGGGALLIRGDPGAGKSSILAEAVARADASSRLRTASPTRKRSGAWPALRPNAAPSASRWGAGQSIEVVEERRAQLMQAAVRQLHLRLDPGGPGHAAAGRVRHDVLEQRALADPGLASEHESPALAGARQSRGNF